MQLQYRRYIIFYCIPLCLISKSITKFQSYLIGCTFDSFSTSWTDRSYIIMLLVVAWLIPLLSIILSHIGIFYRIKNSEVNIVLTNAPEKRLASSSRMKQLKRLGTNSDMPSGGNSLPHVTHRVYYKYTCQNLPYSVIFIFDAFYHCVNV